MDCPDPETLGALVAGGLTTEARAAVANHAAGCDGCHAALEQLMATSLATPAGHAETLPSGPPPGRPRADQGMLLGRGDRIDRYVVESRLGAGGMGVVYAARDPELGYATGRRMAEQQLTAVDAWRRHHR